MAGKKVNPDTKSTKEAKGATLSKKELLDCLNQIGDWLYTVKLAVESCDSNKFVVARPVAKSTGKVNQCKDSDGC
jgi:hypothetical protein